MSGELPTSEHNECSLHYRRAGIFYNFKRFVPITKRQMGWALECSGGVNIE